MSVQRNPQRITMGLGTPGYPGTTGASYRGLGTPPRPVPATRAAVNWEAPENATPQPAPKAHFGKYQQPYAPVPISRERKKWVRGRAPATYQTLDGDPIPVDDWIAVPISPGLLVAIAAGDLEDGGEAEEEPGQAPRKPKTPEDSTRQRAGKRARPLSADVTGEEQFGEQQEPTPPTAE